MCVCVCVRVMCLTYCLAYSWSLLTFALQLHDVCMSLHMLHHKQVSLDTPHYIRFRITIPLPPRAQELKMLWNISTCYKNSPFL